MVPEQTPLLEEDDLEELEDNPEEFAAARKELEDRCRSSNITVEEHEDPFDNLPYLVIYLPEGLPIRC